MAETEISLRHLRALAVLLEAGSVTRAAEILDVGQPAISKMLQRLRAHFGDPLLVRVGQAMTPTPKALSLVEPLKALLATSDALHAQARAFDPAVSTRQFTVLVTDVGMIQFVTPLLARLEAVGPGLRLRALPFDSRSFEARLESGDADIAVGYFTHASAGLKRQRLYADPYASLVRRAHPRVAEAKTAEGFWRERHVVVTASATGHAAHQRLERVLTARLTPEQAQVKVPSFVAAAFLASRTDAVATVPAQLAHFLAPDLGLEIFAPPLDMAPIEIEQFWHERVHEDAGHRWFRHQVFSLMETLGRQHDA